MIRIRGAAYKDEDEAFERAQQELLEAKVEGREAGIKGLSIEMNPFYPFEAAHAEWVRGWHEAHGLVLSRLRRTA